MTFLLVLHRKNKFFEELLQKFKNTALFEIIVRTAGISMLYIILFFLRYYFGVTPCQVLLCSRTFAVLYDVGTTDPVMILVTPKHGANIYFMYLTGREPDGASIFLRTRSKSSSKRSENDKNDVFWTCFGNFTCEKKIACHQS
jgi:hypothetical protein